MDYGWTGKIFNCAMHGTADLINLFYIWIAKNDFTLSTDS